MNKDGIINTRLLFLDRSARAHKNVTSQYKKVYNCFVNTISLYLLVDTHYSVRTLHTVDVMQSPYFAGVQWVTCMLCIRCVRQPVS